MRHHNPKFAAVLLIGSAFFVSERTAGADPVAIDLTLFPATSNYTITGTGVFLVDSSVLTVSHGSFNLDDLISLSLSLSNIPSVPSFTTFSKSDLSGWALAVVGPPFGSNDPTDYLIEAVQFLMDDRLTNADGYGIEPAGAHEFAVCDGPCSSSPRLGIVTISAGRPHEVPEPGSITLLGIGLAGLVLKGRQRNETAPSV